MKKLLTIILCIAVMYAMGQTGAYDFKILTRENVFPIDAQPEAHEPSTMFIAKLPNCKTDTTGGYISIFDTLKFNPICNYELLTKAHLDNHNANNRDTISFFPHKIDVLYKKSGYSRGHCLPFEDLAYSYKSAKASMNELRNLAPQPQNENIGTKLACEDTCRLLANQQGSVQVYCGTWGNYGSMKGINIPVAYWTMIITSDHKALCWWMPTHGDKIGYYNLKDCRVTMDYLQDKIGFEPILVIFNAQIR